MRNENAILGGLGMQTPTILLVDDSAVNLGVVVEGLEGHGYDVLVALDGEEALQRIEVALPDLILLDVMMPGIDGFEVCRRLKAQAATRDIPVIFMTSLGSINDKVSGFEAGGVDYITKPLQVEEARARIDAHLRLRALQKALERKNVALQHEIGERKKAEAELQRNLSYIAELNEQLRLQTIQLEASHALVEQGEAWYRGIVQSAPDGMVVVDGAGKISLVNERLEAMFGYAGGELIGQAMEVLLPLELRETHVAKRAGFFTSDEGRRPMGSMTTGLRACRKDGSEFPVDVSLSRLPDLEGRSVIVCAAIRDITERKHLEDVLAIREQEFRTLLENTPDVIVRYDLACRRTYVNPAWVRVNGIPAQEAVGRSPLELSVRVKPIAAEFEQMLRGVMRSRRSDTMDLVWTNEAGEKVCFALSAIPEFGKDDAVVSVLTVARDISERKRMEDALTLREQELRMLVENSPDTIARYGRDCRRLFVNPSFARLVAGGAEALLGSTPTECPGGLNADLYENKIGEAVASGRDTEFELKWTGQDGVEICSLIRLTPERDANGDVVSVLAIGRDITELNEHRKRIYQMAFYDALTSLPNRALFNDRLRQMITDSEWHAQHAGVMLLDLDHFKAVNDTLGHPAGDELLREAAARLSFCVRGYDTVARLGGDEFAILLPEIRSGDDLGRVAGKIIAAFNEPFLLEGKEVFVSTSIGIAVYPDDGMDADDLVRQSDSAMYFAKRSGRNNFRFYSKDLTESANERLMLESELRRAVERGELSLHYQPKVSLDGGTMLGSEALLRWNHPRFGSVSPVKFIPVAEDCGLIIELGEWVLREACLMACQMNGEHRPLHKIAINLSARQFQSNDLLGTVISVLEETGCQPEWIELEITESLLLEDGGEVLEILNAFRALGMTIAIDDFGTGYSALSYLARFPINTLKIDRSFIHSITSDHFRAELVKAILSIAHCLGQQVVAEGVETMDQALFLQAHGCHIGQGYLFSKPLQREDFLALPEVFELA